MLIVGVVLLLLALAMLGVGAAGLAGRLPRNRWAGVRTPETMRDDEAFRLANKVAAPTMLAAGFLLALGGAAAIALDTWLGILAAVVALIAAVFTAGVGAAAGNKSIEAAAPASSGCGHTCTSCALRDTCQPT